MAARSVTPISATPSQALAAAETIPLQSSSVNTASHASLAPVQHAAPISVTQEGQPIKISALEKLRISSDSMQRLADSMSLEQALANVGTVNHTLYRVMINYHEATRTVRSDEQECMGQILAYHRELEQFPRRVVERRLTQADVDREMDLHSARLVEYDSQLKTWFDHRGQQNVVMARSNDNAIEENVHRLQESIRREDDDRQGHSRRPGELDRWTLDRARRVKEHDRWVLEYILWVRTYDGFSRDRSRNLKEYKQLFARQAHFTRRIANYQIERYFNELERLNETSVDYLMEKTHSANKLKGSDETLQSQKRDLKEGIEPTQALESSQESLEDSSKHMAAEKRRRHSL